LAGQYDLILIPFNSFAEIVTSDDQRRALASIRKHLAPTGRLICTLHNPAVRRNSMDGQLHQRGQFPLPDGSGVVCLSSQEHFDPVTSTVSGIQVFDIVSPDGTLLTRRSLAIQFFLHSQESFEQLATEQGFQVREIWGNYDRSEFLTDASPYMIWVLEHRKDHL
jgi:hypothetical protein